MARRGESPRRTFYAFVLGGLIIYALVSLAIAAATADTCGDGPKEWQFIPPQWECTGYYWGG
jgi:hypothetical protein